MTEPPVSPQCIDSYVRIGGPGPQNCELSGESGLRCRSARGSGSRGGESALRWARGAVARLGAWVKTDARSQINRHFPDPAIRLRRLNGLRVRVYLVRLYQLSRVGQDEADSFEHRLLLLLFVNFG
jgi:hypothetical protein